MTCILHRDPDRRCKPLHEWPEVDRLLWLAALVPGDFVRGRRFAGEIHRRDEPRDCQFLRPLAAMA